jgi:hypothetical protein
VLFFIDLKKIKMDNLYRFASVVAIIQIKKEMKIQM